MYQVEIIYHYVGVHVYNHQLFGTRPINGHSYLVIWVRNRYARFIPVERSVLYD